MDQAGVDVAIQAYYVELFDEDARLTTRSAQGRLEFERTQEIVRSATSTPARVLDLGGATGVHAAALAADGYEVVLVDPVPDHVEAARRHGTFEAVVGDARRLDLPDGLFDAVLMAGPLYHLLDRRDRLQALREARRVCRPGGWVHAAAIPRFVAFAVAALDRDVLDASPQAWLDLLRSGVPASTVRFPAGHFHTPEELQDEMVTAGLTGVTVAGLEGPAGLALETGGDVDQDEYAAAKTLARRFGTTPSIRDFSCHLLATGQA